VVCEPEGSGHSSTTNEWYYQNFYWKRNGDDGLGNMTYSITEIGVESGIGNSGTLYFNFSTDTITTDMLWANQTLVRE
jgi:hypothetical protein